MKYIKKCTNMCNLLIFIYLFVAASFDYYLITFNMKYIPGNVFVNTIVSSLAEAISTYLAGALRAAMGPRYSLTISFALCCIASILLAIAESRKDWIQDIPPIILAAKFGISAAFGLLYMCTSHFFDSKFMGTVFGICNVIARSFTILAPMVAEADFPTPVISLIFSCFIATILTIFLRDPHARKANLAEPGANEEPEDKAES